MSSLNRDSSAEFPVDMKHVLHVWKVLNGVQFSSKSFGLQNIPGRRKALALLMNRSVSRVIAWTTNWNLEGPEEAPESSKTCVEVNVEETILEPVVSVNADISGPGRKSLISSKEYGAIRDVIHTMYKDKTYVTLKSLLGPVQEKLDRKLGKATLYRVLRRMGFKYQ